MIGYAALVAAWKWELAWAEVEKLVNASPDELATLEADLRALPSRLEAEGDQE